MELSILDSCTRCGRCVKVCPSLVFRQEAAGTPVTLHRPENCIACGHCVAACPARAVVHGAFPAERVREVGYAALPSPEALEELMAVRRSCRTFRPDPIPREKLDRIVAAADLAPTATNARSLGYVVVTGPERLRQVTEFTLGHFGHLVRLLDHPLVRPWLRPLIPGACRYVPVFRRMCREWQDERVDRILRGATALIAVHAPRHSRFGAEDANLACQNASLMAESLGVGQLYMGFVLTAARQRKGALERLLGLGPDRRVQAVMALGLPQFRYPRRICRQPSEVRRL